MKDLGKTIVYLENLKWQAKSYGLQEESEYYDSAIKYLKAYKEYLEHEKDTH